jgi:hypothetical protein
VRIRTADLDQDTLNYLKDLWNTHGAAGNGVFIPRGGSGIAWRVLTALALLGGVVYLALSLTDTSDLTFWLAGCAGLAVWCLAGAFTRLWARRRHGVGNFLFVDALHLWDVSPEMVRVMPLGEVSSIRGTNYHRNRAYTHTAIELTTSGGVIPLTLRSIPLAEELVRFVNALIAVRETQGSEATRRDPVLLGALAAAIAHGQTELNGAALKLRDLPRPLTRSTAGALARRQLVPWLAGAAAFGVALLLFLQLNRVTQHHSGLPEAPAADRDRVDPLNAASGPRP